MQENNMSVFGTVIRNEEIADFMRLLNLAREIFKQELTVVEIMPGGLTNKNFRAVTENGTQIAIRLAGQGTANYINRPGEKHNAGEIAGLGIAPEIYYYDPKTGSQIVEYIDIVSGQYSVSAAAGLFKSIVSLILVLSANKIAKLCGESGFY